MMRLEGKIIVRRSNIRKKWQTASDDLENFPNNDQLILINIKTIQLKLAKI